MAKLMAGIMNTLSLNRGKIRNIMKPLQNSDGISEHLKSIEVDNPVKRQTLPDMRLTYINTMKITALFWEIGLSASPDISSNAEIHPGV
ncbi:MAG: hypothetical protein P8Z78_14480 [Gammaproteobacteria bacterium]